MKITFLLITFTSMMVWGMNSYSQSKKLSLELKSASLREVIETIERSSEFIFLYQDQNMNMDRRISLAGRDLSITEILDKIFEGTENVYRINDRQIIIGKLDDKSFPNSLLAAQQKTVTGIVTGANGEPIPGVAVLVKGTTTGTVTDIDGNFSIPNVQLNSTLVFSFVGMKTQEIKYNGQESLKVSLVEDAVGLDEVIVVGYGVQKKSDLTGSVSSVTSKMLEERPQTNIVQSLQGAVPGLNISITGSNAEGSSSQTRVRANNSITASNKPLIILDGIPFDGPWSEINASDIQSLEILKDASSAAIYGARGANGVILITTKKGEKGKMTVSYDGFIQADKPTNIPRLMNGEEFWKYKIEALIEANTTTPTESNPEPWMGSITETEKRMHDAGKETDWIDLTTRTAFKHSHNLSFRGGIEKTRYFVSLNYTKSEGISLNDQFERYNLRTNLEQDFTSWLKFSTNSQFGRYDRSGSEPSFGRAFLMNPLAEAYNSDGTVRTSAWEDSSEAFSVNPLSSINDKNSDIRYKFITNNALDFSIPFVKGLGYKLNSGFTMESSSYKNYQGMDTFYGARSNGILDTDDWNSSDWIIENILSYNRDLGKHRIFFTGLYSAERYTREGQTVNAKGFPNDVMYYYQSAKASSITGTGSYTSNSHISQMARVNYSYNDRYLLTLTARRDGFSAFGDKTKFGVFPSVALGWNFSNEDFYKKLNIDKVLTNAKLRLTWGENGNEAVSAYTTLPNLSTFNYLSEDNKPMYGFYPGKLASPNLGWETTTSLNTGFDLTFLDGRIQTTVDMYWSNTKDLLLSRSIPIINGTTSITENLGKTASHGIELQIISNNISTKTFSWNTTFNFSRYKSEIKDVGLYDENGKATDDISSGWFIGKPLGANYDYVFTGIWQITDPSNPNGKQDPDYTFSIPGYMKYKDADGVTGITPADKQVIGSSIPKFMAGMTNVLCYKNFTLSFFINSSVGRTARNYLMDLNSMSYRQNKLMIDFWTPENPINSYPKNALDSSPNPMGAGFYQKTDFLRIQDVTLSYKLPKQLLTKVGLKKLEFYMNLKNLATWTSWGGLDPEFIDSQRATPQTKGYIFGVKFDI